MSRKHWLAAYGEKIPCEINPDSHPSVLAMLEAAMKRFAEKPAFRSFGHILTYADADRLSRNFAAFLQNKLGVKKGDRIAVMLPNIAAFPLAMLGIVRAGGVQVNVNPLYTPRELEHQLNDAGVEIIVIFSGVSATLAELAEATRVKHVITVDLGDGSGSSSRAPRWTLGSITSSDFRTPSVRARIWASRRHRRAATICSSCSTLAEPRGFRRVPRCPNAISWPIPSSSRASFGTHCAPVKKSWSRRCRSTTCSP